MNENKHRRVRSIRAGPSRPSAFALFFWGTYECQCVRCVICVTSRETPQRRIPDAWQTLNMPLLSSSWKTTSYVTPHMRETELGIRPSRSKPNVHSRILWWHESAFKKDYQHMCEVTYTERERKRNREIRTIIHFFFLCYVHLTFHYEIIVDILEYFFYIVRIREIANFATFFLVIYIILIVYTISRYNPALKKHCEKG